MPKYNHENIGGVMDHVYAKGIITSVDYENDLADVTVENYQNGSNIPLFYHCEPDSEERDNGAIEGAAAAFSAGTDDPEDGDEVIVMVDIDTKYPVRIVGFVDGIRLCGCSFAVFGRWNDELEDTEYLVWNMKTKALATNVTSNDGEIVTSFPAPYGEEENNGISLWLDNRESCEDVESLWRVLANNERVLVSSSNIDNSVGTCLRYYYDRIDYDVSRTYEWSSDYGTDTQYYTHTGHEYYVNPDCSPPFFTDVLHYGSYGTVTNTGTAFEAKNTDENPETLTFAKEQTTDTDTFQVWDGTAAGFVSTKATSVSIIYTWDLFSPAQVSDSGATSGHCEVVDDGRGGTVTRCYFAPDVELDLPEPSYSISGFFHENGWLMMFTSFTQNDETTISAISEYGLSEEDLKSNPTSFTENAELTSLLSSSDNSWSLYPSYYK